MEKEYGFNQLEQEANVDNQEKLNITDASVVKIINHYCGHEAGVRNLRKCIDRIFRKVVAKIESGKDEEEEHSKEQANNAEAAADIHAPHV